MPDTFNVNFVYGASASGGISFGRSYYTGDPRNISADMLKGSTHGVMITGGYIGDVSVSGSYSNTNDGHGFINEGVGVGLGFGLFAGYQYQYTPGVSKLWKW